MKNAVYDFYPLIDTYQKTHSFLSFLTLLNWSINIVQSIFHEVMCIIDSLTCFLRCLLLILSLFFSLIGGWNGHKERHRAL